MSVDQRLARLAADAFPPTPDLAPAVAARLRARDERPAPSRRLRLWLVLAALLVPATAVAAVPGLRDPVLRWLGLSHVKVVRVTRLAELPVLSEADLGTAVPTVAAAARLAGFAVQVTPPLGRPRRVYVAAGEIVTLVYGAAVVTQVQARDEPHILAKQIAPGTDVSALDVDGAPGVFFSGAPHEVSLVTPDGRFVGLEPRLAGNTLAFQRDGLVVRVEGERLTRQRALTLARTIRP
jgi:hypothetical protein